MLTQCPECELQVSDKAPACPHCGYPMKSTANESKKRRTHKRRRLPNGFGQISEIKNRNLRKPFRAMVTVGKTSEGRPICKPLKPDAYFATYNEAYAALVEYNRNPYDLDPSITMQELFDRWSEEHIKTLKTKSSIQKVPYLWRYCSSIYNMRVIDLRTRHIKGCLENGHATVKGENQPTTPEIKGSLKSLFNMMLDYAVEYEIVDKNVARTFSLSDEDTKVIKTTKKGHIAFSDEEMELLWQHVNDKDFVDMLLIQCYSGWRPQELDMLEVKDVDLEKRLFKGGMKTDAGTDRIIPIHTKILPLVEKRYNVAVACGSKYLFFNPSKPTEPYAYSRHRTMFNMVRDELKLNQNHRPHDGRVQFVTSAKKYGVDEYAIKYIVGHVIADITERVYTKRDFSWLTAEIEKIR